MACILSISQQRYVLVDCCNEVVTQRSEIRFFVVLKRMAMEEELAMPKVLFDCDDRVRHRCSRRYIMGMASEVPFPGCDPICNNFVLTCILVGARRRCWRRRRWSLGSFAQRHVNIPFLVRSDVCHVKSLSMEHRDVDVFRETLESTVYFVKSRNKRKFLGCLSAEVTLRLEGLGFRA